MQRCIEGLHYLGDRLKYAAPMLAGMDEEAKGNALFALNESAVRQRYPGDKTDYADAPVFKPHHGMACRPVAALKALHCLIYQCSEGVADESPLYMELDRAANQLATDIIMGSAEYDKAPW
jgi:hypothetical protein